MRFTLYYLKTGQVAYAYSGFNKTKKPKKFIIDEYSRPKSHKTVPLLEYALTEAIKYVSPTISAGSVGGYKFVMRDGDEEYVIFTTSWDSTRDKGWRPFRLHFNRELPADLKKKCLDVFINYIRTHL